VSKYSALEEFMNNVSINTAINQASSERPAAKVNGYAFFVGGLLLLILGGYVFFTSLGERNGWAIMGSLVLATLGALILSGLFVVQPKEARVLTLFGNYVGSVRHDGLWWVNPFTMHKKISLRVRNFQSEKMKVNDFNGNPIEIAAVVVWRVVDSAKALFDVENYETFVTIQAETAIRNISTRYPYEGHDGDANHSLRSHPDEVGDALRHELHERLELAGLEVMETRLSHLAYAPEIAQAMLRRQQAEAVIAARQKIVDGAVGMVEIALKRLEAEGVVSLDEERKAAMVNNLMVALVSENNAQPIINTGSLYS
jgi:regulator of protease activity HflC (stomatin/prohibitin superfamily)